MRYLQLHFLTLIFSLSLVNQMAAEEPKNPGSETPPGIFGEFILAGGERVIGLYLPEQGTIEVYGPDKTRAVKASDIVATRRLAPEPEAAPVSLDVGHARVSTLASCINDAQANRKRIENQRSELQKDQQSVRLERSKREEGNKDAQEAMLTEKDPERKAVYAALSMVHLKAIAATNVASAGLDTRLAAIEARFNVALADYQDLQARMNWLHGRLATMSRDKTGK